MSRVFEHEYLDLGYDDLVTENKDGKRLYNTPDGNQYPSVTSVLSIINEDKIAAWRKRVGEEEANRVGHRASSRGTSVHSILERYLLNEDTGATINLLNQTSTTSNTSTEQEGLGSAGWISNSNTVNIAGDYKLALQPLLL